MALCRSFSIANKCSVRYWKYLKKEKEKERQEGIYENDTRSVLTLYYIVSMLNVG